MELVRLESGSIVMEVGRTRLRLASGSVVFFWGLSPHQIIRRDAEALLCRVSIPVAAFVQFQLPQRFTQTVLRGKAITEGVSKSPRLDKALFRKWVADFPDASNESRSILLLEIEARLRRLANAVELGEGGTACDETPDILDRAMAMGRFIAEHHTEPLHDADIARAARLSDQYAMRLFSKTFGLSMHRYLTNHRITHACHLLATTDSKIIDVAFESGFGSLSRFYESFARACEQSPHEYRKSHRGRN